MNMPTLPQKVEQAESHAQPTVADAASVPLPGLLPPELLAPLYSWLERQVAKGLALVATITGGIMDADGPGRAFAWFVGVLAFVLEIRASRATEKTRREMVDAVKLQQSVIVQAYNLGRRD